MIYDVIGDVHGCAAQLRQLLERLGYTHLPQKGDLHPPVPPAGDHDHLLLLLGDIIDRGPDQRETLELVRALIAGGRAVCLMGNHEFNAVMEAMGLRHKRSPAHLPFLQAYPEGSADFYDAIEWMKGLPWWFEAPGIGAVHACWNLKCFSALIPHLDERRCARSEQIFRLSARGEELWDDAEIVLKGAEMKLPEGVRFFDKEGIERHEVRVRWWLDAPYDIAEAAINTGDLRMGGLKARPDPWPWGADSYRVPGEERRIYVGHYWLECQERPDAEVARFSEQIFCLDFSCVRGGKLCACQVELDDDGRFIGQRFVTVPGLKSC